MRYEAYEIFQLLHLKNLNFLQMGLLEFQLEDIYKYMCCKILTKNTISSLHF